MMKLIAACAAMLVISNTFVLGQQPDIAQTSGRSNAAAARNSPGVSAARPSPQTIRARAIQPTNLASQRGIGGMAERFSGRHVVPAAVRQESKLGVGPERTNTEPAPAANMRKLTGLDRAFHERLASIDRIRDRAIETGNLTLLDRADELERTVREQQLRFASRPNRNEEYVIEADANSISNLNRSVDYDRRASSHYGSANAPGDSQNTGFEFSLMTSEQAKMLGGDSGQFNSGAALLRRWRQICPDNPRSPRGPAEPQLPH